MANSTVERRGVRRVGVAAFGVTLAASTLLPWYSSQALADFDQYRGNPLPFVDWVVAALATLAAVAPRTRLWGGVVGLVSVGITTLMMAGDEAEGVEVDPGVGLFVAMAAAAALMWSHWWGDRAGRPGRRR